MDWVKHCSIMQTDRVFCNFNIQKYFINRIKTKISSHSWYHNNGLPYSISVILQIRNLLQERYQVDSKINEKCKDFRNLWIEVAWWSINLHLIYRDKRINLLALKIQWTIQSLSTLVLKHCRKEKKIRNRSKNFNITKYSSF